MTRYCATQRHCLHIPLVFRLPLGFPGPMFHSGSGTQFMLHQLRTTASCLWLYVAPHSTLYGRRYRFELFIDPRFPEMPAALGFPLAALVCRHTLRSHPVRHGLRPFGTSPGSVLHRLSLGHRSPGHFLPGAVSVSPNLIRQHWSYGLDRRREFHPPAPITAAPALLEAEGELPFLYFVQKVAQDEWLRI